VGETTKTPSSLRTIGIPPFVSLALLHQKDTQPAEHDQAVGERLERFIGGG